MIRSFERPEESASTRLHHLMQQGMIVAPFVYDQAHSTLFDEVTSLLGLPEVYELEQRYRVGEQAAAPTSSR